MVTLVHENLRLIAKTHALYPSICPMRTAVSFFIAKKVTKKSSSKKGDCCASFILVSKYIFYRFDYQGVTFNFLHDDRRTFDSSFTIACFLNKIIRIA